MKYNPIQKSDEQYYIQCPFCDDKKQHLGINFKLNAFHCFRCNTSGNIKKLIQFLSNKPLNYIPIQIPSKKQKNSINNIMQIFEKPGQLNNKFLTNFFKHKKILPEYQSKILNLIAKNPDKFKLVDHFLFFMYDYKPIQARNLFPNAKPKYLTINSYYFNLSDKNNIALVESPFSVIAGELLQLLDCSFYATLGKSNTKRIFDLLKFNYPNKKFYIIPDKDNIFYFIQNYDKFIDCNLVLFKKYYGNDLFDFLKTNDIIEPIIIEIKNGLQIKSEYYNYIKCLQI